jgi:hypothetical protein
MPRKTRMYPPDIPVHGYSAETTGMRVFSAKTSTVTFWTAFKRVKVDSAWHCMPTC